MKYGKIILISGASSSGKSTLARGLQKCLTDPFLHMQLDSYIEMLPHTDDWEMFRQMVRGMNRSIVGMVEERNNLIVDHVLFENAWLQQCVELLHAHYVLFVGLHCPLKELERRERERGPSGHGYARQQFEDIHKGKVYDLELDTCKLSPAECVERVVEFYNQRQPSAFKMMWNADERHI